MNNKFSLWVISFFVCAIVPGISSAYSYNSSAERILRFNSGIEVHEDGSMTVTEKVSPKILSLPLYPELNFSRLNRVVEGIRDFFGKATLPGDNIPK